MRRRKRIGKKMRDFASWLPWPSFMDTHSGRTEQNNKLMRTLSSKMKKEKGETWLRDLQRLHPYFQQDRIMFHQKVAQILQVDPSFATEPHLFGPYHREYLLYRILCYKPPLNLVTQVYAAYPPALHIPNKYDKSPLHRACEFHASALVIQFLLKIQPEAVKINPSPLLLSIDPKTPKDSLDLLIKAFPPALMTMYDECHTTLDLAFDLNIETAVINTMIKCYPNEILEVRMSSQSSIVNQDIGIIIASNHRRIKVLNIAFMTLCNDTLEAIWRTLASNSTVVEFIQTVSTNSTVPQSLLDSLEWMLSTNTTVKKLSYLQGINCRSIGLAFTAGLAKNNSIRELTIEGGLEDQTYSELITVLSQRKNVSMLCLRDTSICCSISIASMVFLQHLDLTNCNAGPTIAIPLAALLQATSNLRILKVAHNAISSEGTVIIMNAFAKNSSVRQIEYQGNTLGELGRSALVRVLRDSNVTIKQIQLDPSEETVTQDYYCSLNQAGRKEASDATLEEFVQLLINSPSFDIQHGLLYHVPHIWCGLID
jgi:hypothetical protein